MALNSNRHMDVPRQVKQAHRLGIKVPFLGSDSWGSHDLVKLCGRDCEGYYFSTHYSAEAEKFTQRREELFRLTDILIVAERYGREITGREDVAEILEELTRLGPPCVGVTSGERGSALRYHGEIIHVPAFPVKVVDTTGAGDVFHGAFLYGVLRGWEARHILLFANAVSALKCTRLGGRTGIPRVKEVLDFLHARGQGIPAGGL